MMIFSEVIEALTCMVGPKSCAAAVMELTDNPIVLLAVAIAAALASVMWKILTDTVKDLFLGNLTLLIATAVLVALYFARQNTIAFFICIAAIFALTFLPRAKPFQRLSERGGKVLSKAAVFTPAIAYGIVIAIAGVNAVPPVVAAGAPVAFLMPIKGGETASTENYRSLLRAGRAIIFSAVAENLNETLSLAGIEVNPSDVRQSEFEEFYNTFAQVSENRLAQKIADREPDESTADRLALAFASKVELGEHEDALITIRASMTSFYKKKEPSFSAAGVAKGQLNKQEDLALVISFRLLEHLFKSDLGKKIAVEKRRKSWEHLAETMSFRLKKIVGSDPNIDDLDTDISAALAKHKGCAQQDCALAFAELLERAAKSKETKQKKAPIGGNTALIEKRDG